MKRTAKKTAAAKHDWSRLDAMTAAEKHAAAVSDPDNRPLTAEDMKQRTDHGCVGFPERATADKGRKFLNAAIQRTAEVIEALLRKRLPPL